MTEEVSIATNESLGNTPEMHNNKGDNPESPDNSNVTMEEKANEGGSHDEDNVTDSVKHCIVKTETDDQSKDTDKMSDIQNSDDTSDSISDSKVKKEAKMSEFDKDKAVKRELSEAFEIRVPKVRTRKDMCDYKWMCGGEDRGGKTGRRPDTPPLQRLMRQDFPALKSDISSPSPPKRFKDSSSHSSHASHSSHSHKEGFTSKLASVIIPSTSSTVPPKLASHPRQLLSHSMASLRSSSSKSGSLMKQPFNPLLSRSYPVSQPVFPSRSMPSECDQPLDLSKKPIKSSSDSKTKSSYSKFASSVQDNGLLSTSLQSLQQKFGGDFHLRGLRKPLNYMLYGPEIPALHQALLHSATMGLPPYSLPFANGFPKFTPEKHHRHNHNSTPSPNKSKHDECYRPSVSKSSDHSHSERLTKREMADKDSEQDQVTPDEKQGENYTNHLCTCGRWFDGLYSLSLHLQETGHLPARNKSVSLLEYPKLVRGQDMWLNQESEQTRRILRCIQCGESFKTLPLLTVHMMKTQHYTKIVSSEHARRAHKCSAYCDKDTDKECVFKCKVCEESFSDMEGLANHMIMSGHHKKQARLSQHDVQFKKRKRYSFEEALHPFGNPNMADMIEYKRQMMSGHSSPDVTNEELDDNKISCENCGQKIEMKSFVEHVRACLGQKLKEDIAKFEKEKENLKKLEKEKRKRMEMEQNDSAREKGSCSPTKRQKVDNETGSIKEEPESDNETEVVVKKEKDESESDLAIPKSERQDSKPKPDHSDSRHSSEENDSNESVDNGKSILKEIQTLVDSKGHMNEKSEVGKHSIEAKSESRKSKSNVAKRLDIIDPDNSKDASVNEGSALSAMESFIKKSFSNKFDYKKGNIIISPNSSSDATVHPRPTNSSSIGLDSSDYLNRYKNFYAALNLNNGYKYESPEKEKIKSESSHYKNGLMSGQDGDRNGKFSPSPCSDNGKTNGRESVASVASDSSSVLDKNENLETKYLSLETNAESKCETSTKSSSKSSALDNLSSFVYGQTLTSEHPLDSLQRLITKSDIPALMSGGGAAGRFKFLPPHLQFHPPGLDLTSPLNLSVRSPKAGADSDDDDARSPKSRQDEDSFSDYEATNSPSNSDSDPAEYRCAACSRRFASKGSYRYHLSRCHLSSVKRYGIKEAFNMSPYIYLPLDHTAKFSKYYEMAKELANKAKENKAK